MVSEYQSLRQELLQLAGSISRWQMVGFVAAGVALAAGIAMPFGFGVAAGALLLTAGCICGIIHDLRSILRIAAYIQAVHEGRDTGAMWETRQEMIAGADITNPLKPGMTPILSLLWAGLVGAIGPYVSVFWLADSLPEITLILSLMPLLAWLVFWANVRQSYTQIYSGEFKQKTMQAFYESLRRP